MILIMVFLEFFRLFLTCLLSMLDYLFNNILFCLRSLIILRMLNSVFSLSLPLSSNFKYLSFFFQILFKNWQLTLLNTNKNTLSSLVSLMYYLLDISCPTFFINSVRKLCILWTWEEGWTSTLFSLKLSSHMELWRLLNSSRS